MVKITEENLHKDIIQGLMDTVLDGHNYIGAIRNDTSAVIMDKLHRHVDLCARKRKKVEDIYDEYILSLGCVWGNQIVLKHNWEWSKVIFHEHNDSNAIGVFPKDRSKAIYPFHFIYGCIVNGAENKILLSYNMMSAGKIPQARPMEYINVMDCVHYIVPP